MHDHLIVRAAGYANQTKELAQAKGMKGFVKRADKLLTHITEC